MKKWLILILLLVTAAETFVPCCGFDNCCADQLAATNHKEHKDEGACSPFFACATCIVSAELTKTEQINFPAIENTIHYCNTISFNLTSYNSSFWQPPRSC